MPAAGSRGRAAMARLRRAIGSGQEMGRPGPGLAEPLGPWTHVTAEPHDQGSPAPEVVVLTYNGVSSTEVELVADALARPLRARVRLVAADPSPVVGVEPARQLRTEPLDAVDRATALVIPGGLGWKREAGRDDVARWLDRVTSSAGGVLAVSTGSLLLASIGLLTDREATGHWLATDLLAGLGARPSADRIVGRQRLVTTTGARSGVEAAADLARWIRFGPG